MMLRQSWRSGARFLVAAFAVALVGSGVLPQAAHADGGWLDDQAVTWNTPDMPIPQPAHQGGPMNTDPRCGQQARPADTDADRAVMGAGWTLFGSYAGGWGVQIVRGLADYDGMCRPVEYQAFVFVDGQFAGTLSPMTMDSRSDGALTQLDFYGPEQITGGFVRYTPQDALCCPSARSTVQYKVVKTASGPVLQRERTFTEPTATAVAPPTSQPSSQSGTQGSQPAVIPARPPAQIPPMR